MHLSAVYRLLHVRGRVEAVLAAQRHGMIGRLAFGKERPTR
jgi:DNA-binding CsgD family transcriptional regulator